jgi:hypothetical protein
VTIAETYELRAAIPKKKLKVSVSARLRKTAVWGSNAKIDDTSMALSTFLRSEVSRKTIATLAKPKTTDTSLAPIRDPVKS